MATDFTQDTLLHFLQSCGGSVKNSDLLLHFRNFIRDHADRNRNRELFKKFVNSVATVRQVDGVSYVFLRKKFKGHVPGGGGGGRGSAEPRPSRVPTGKNAEPSPETGVLSPAGNAAKPLQKPQRREGTTPAPPGETTRTTILPVAGLVLNNNNYGATNLNLKPRQVIGPKEPPGRPVAAAQVVSHVSKKTHVKSPRPPEPPDPDQCPRGGQHRVGFGLPPGDTPVVAAVSHYGDIRQQVPVPEAPRGREACLQPEGALHQGPPLHHFISLEPQDAPRRIRHRPSYKSAVSYDEDREEEGEEVQMRPDSAGGAWSPSTLGDLGRAFSASSPCIVDPNVPSVVSPPSSSSSERQIQKIFLQDAETMPPGGPGQCSQSVAGLRGRWAGPGMEPGLVPAESTRRSLPLEAEHYGASAVPRDDVHADRRYSHPAGVQSDPSHGLNPGQGAWLSSSAGLSSSERLGSPRGPGQNSSYEDPQAIAGVTGGESQIHEAIQRAQRKKSELGKHHDDGNHPTGRLQDDQEATAHLPPFHHSSDHLHDDQYSTAREWLLSTGDLHDREEVESSEGSNSSLPRPRPATARRLSSHLRSRMCRSLGADLDQLLQEEARAGGGSEAARLNRLHLISSSLSLRYDLSSSSLSSCSTPPRCHSLADLDEGAEGRPGRRRSSPTAAASSPTSPSAQHEGSSRQSLVPLEPREHAWLVKGASGAWPDIYTLFREDSSLLNRQDFISGFTVLHWIAKHGDHRVLNTLWYGVQKAGLTFDMNAKSTCGHTPLHIAAIHANNNITRLLVTKFNADVKLRDTAGKKPWQYLSHAAPPDVFQLLGAPSRPAGGGQGGGRTEAPGFEQGQTPRQQQQHRRRRHHLSFASSGEKQPTMTGTTRVKRSSSIAAFLKHKSLHRFHGHQSDSSI
ncbi:ankyrin repeat domain-containing protein SOWAHB-like [Cyclopterus lumpus]|uniref:SOWAHA-C winged helix-turn-helix domain-containing protein n=1 Tax=Cyclopterus lumpus TaxID=8103 RepID=A0A8C2WZ90_CYCLU|nr:ankyrin repeat domain-containing protein SOWAHB-like [Cyclopterus lumpus]